MIYTAYIKSRTLFVIAAVGVLLSGAAFLYSNTLEGKISQQEAQRTLEHQRARIEGQVAALVEIIDAAASFMSIPGQINRDDFARFTLPVLGRHPEIYSIQWIPRVPESDRHRFEQQLIAEGFTQGITELAGGKTSLISAADRPDYYPVLFAEPFRRNSTVVGFDVSTRPRNQAIMTQSLRQGRDFTASSPFRIVQDRLGDQTVIILRPVYAVSEPLTSEQQRQSALQGYVVALVRPQVLLNQIQSYQPGVGLELEDLSADQAFRLGRAGPLLDSRPAVEDTFAVLSRQWRIRQTIGASAGTRYPLSLLVLLAGLALTAVMVLLLRRLQRALIAAVAASEHSQSYLDTVETMMLALDQEGRITMVNRMACEMLGKPEAELLGLEWFSKRFMADATVHYQAFRAAMQKTPATRAHSDTEYAVRTVDDDEQIIAWHNALQFDASGQAQGMLCAGINVTRQRYLQELEHIQGRAMQSTLEGATLKQVLEQVVQGIEKHKPRSMGSILLLDEAGQRLHCGAAPSLHPAYNHAIEGLQIGDGVGSCGTAAYRQERVIVEDIQRHPFWAPFKELAGSYNLASCWSEPIFGKKGRILGTFAIYHSRPCAPTSSDLEMIQKIAALVGLVVEEFQTEQQLLRYANTDELTALPNRRNLLQRLDHELARTRRYKESMALCMLDIDHFKRINDSYGHEFGDQVLIELGRVMNATLRETDMAGRIGGEEFAIVLPGADHERASQAAERIRQAAAGLELTTEAGTRVRFTVSIGVAVIDGYSPTEIESTQVLSVADRCLYSAKRGGRNQVSFIPAVLEPLSGPDHS